MKIVAVLALLALCIGFYFLGYRDGKMKQKCINLGIIAESLFPEHRGNTKEERKAYKGFIYSFFEDDDLEKK